MKKIFYLLLLILITSGNSCKKKEQSHIMKVEGTVVDARLNIKLKGVKAKLSAKQLSTSGIYSSAFKHISTQETGSDGKFSISFEKSDAIEYKLEIQKEKYWPEISFFNSDHIKPDIPYYLDFEIIPQATIRINVKNVNPEGNNDRLVLKTFGENYKCHCCTNLNWDISGAIVDTSHTCSLYGHYYYKIFYTTYKSNSGTKNFQDSIYCVPFDTTEFNLYY